MANNLDLSPDGQMAFSLAALRALDYAGPALTGQHLVPGVFFSLDPDSANTVDVTSVPGELMTLRLGVEKPGRWLTLNLGVHYDWYGVPWDGNGQLGRAAPACAPTGTTSAAARTTTALSNATSLRTPSSSSFTEYSRSPPVGRNK